VKTLLTQNSSHPESTNYGKHLTSKEVVELFEPSEETVEAVWNWLVSSGIPDGRISRSRNKQVRERPYANRS
jgi:tripeptidyl-peptidase I